MPLWLSLAKGPLAIFALGVLVLGLVRSGLLIVWDLWVAKKRSLDVRAITMDTLFPPGDDGLPALRLKTSLKWMYFFASLCFLLGVLVCGLFLSNHLSILDSLVGISWPALPKPILDWTAVVAILGGWYILILRLYIQRGSSANRWRNSLLLLNLLILFATGYLAGMIWNPIPYNGLMLFHAVLGLATLVLVPFSQISLTLFVPVNRAARLPVLKHEDGGAQTLVHMEEQSS